MTPRKPLLALAGGLCMPGLGHLYAGDFVHGVSCLLGVSLLVPAAARLALWAPSGWLCFIAVAGVACTIALYVWSAVDALRLARRRRDAPPSAYQRPSVYALYVVVGYVFVLAPVTSYAKEHALETFVVPSRSMLPTIFPGDRVFADKTVGKLGGAKLWRGALAIFVYPNDRTAIFIKRVIGLPGDRVEIEGERVSVNGRQLALTAATDGVLRERGEHGDYSVLVGSSAQNPEKYSYLVGNGEIFVLGDNRPEAVDSRRFGAVPIADVLGIARQVWFSAHEGEGVRWQRIGRVLR